MIYFEGGGWCGDKDIQSTAQNCYQRSLTDLGSSKKYPDSLSVGDGLLSNNVLNSFKDFTKVYMKYCDGSGHQGTRSDPVAFKDAKLYFRGSNLTITKLDHLEKTHGLFSKSTEILVSGCSAGGLATYTWADYIRNRSSHKNVVAAPDSGIFLDSANFHSKVHEYRNWFENLFHFSNSESSPPVPDCVKAFPKEPFRCMFAENMEKFIKTPLFPLQSLYDSWSLPNILGIGCAKDSSLKACNAQEMAYIEDYHKNTSKVLTDITSRAENGCWAPVCVDHCYTFGTFYNKNFEIPMGSGNTCDKTMKLWYDKHPGNHRHIDTGSWPSNKPCSGVAGTKALQCE